MGYTHTPHTRAHMRARALSLSHTHTPIEIQEITELKNSLEKVKSRLEQAKEWISKLKDKLFENKKEQKFLIEEKWT